MNILFSLASLDPAQGGPPVVVQELSSALADLGHSVQIVARPAARELPLAHPAIQRLPSLHAGIHAASPAARPALVHDFGLWLPIHHRSARLSFRSGVPYLNSPCGMLMPWALACKPLKKHLAWWLYQRRDLARSRALIASSEPEAGQLRRFFPRKPILTVPYGVRVPRKKPNFTANGQRTMLFLGRLHPVKGLVPLAHAWSQLRPHGWRCILAGPDEAGHQRQLCHLMENLGCRPDFEFRGLVGPEEKCALFDHAELLVAPSFCENFGLSVAEALAAGLPVITTTATPWHKLRAADCGWVVPPTVDYLKLALYKATSAPPCELRAMGERGRQWVTRHHAWPVAARELSSAYEWLLHGGHKPDCVHLPESGNGELVLCAN